MPAGMEMRGLTELRDTVRKYPETLTSDAGVIVIAHAEDAQRQIVTGYPTGPTGNLKRGVTVERNKSKWTSAAIVRSRAPHAHLFERGTKPRRTSEGAYRGRMPVAPEAQQMIPKVVRLRRRMIGVLKAMLEDHGFEVRET